MNNSDIFLNSFCSSVPILLTVEIFFITYLNLTPIWFFWQAPKLWFKRDPWLSGVLCDCVLVKALWLSKKMWTWGPAVLLGSACFLFDFQILSTYGRETNFTHRVHGTWVVTGWLNDIFRMYCLFSWTLAETALSPFWRISQPSRIGYSFPDWLSGKKLQTLDWIICIFQLITAYSVT